MANKSLLELLPSDYLKRGSKVKILGKVQEIFCFHNFKQFQVNGEFYHEKIVNQAMTSPFKMSIAKRLIGDNFTSKSDRQLVKDLYQVNRYIKTIIDGDKEELIEGRYYKILDSSSASGLVPVDPWLLHNLQFTKTRVTEQLSQRLSVHTGNVSYLSTITELA